MVAWVKPDYIRVDGLEDQDNELMVFKKADLAVVVLHFKCSEGEKSTSI